MDKSKEPEKIVSMTIYETVTINRDGQLSLEAGKTLDDVLHLVYNLALELGAARNEIARQRLMCQMEARERGELLFEPPWEYTGPRV